MPLKEFLAKHIENEDIVSEALELVGSNYVPKKVYRETKTELENKFSTLNSEYEELKVSNMNKEEKYKYELEQADKIKTDYLKKSNRLTASQMFVDAGISEEVYGAFIDSVVSTDENQTKGSVENLIGTLNKFKENTVQSVKSKMADETQTPEGGEGAEIKDYPTHAEF